MARPAVLQNAAILEAAREVFLSRGFRATAAEVALRAGVSEGSIFKRFHSKFELFQAAMGSLEEEPAFILGLSKRVGRGDIRQQLVELGTELAAYLRQVVPLHLMAWSNPGPDGTPSILCAVNPVALRVLKGIRGYFEAEMRLGRIARHDPELVARSFMGAVHNFVIFDLMFQAGQELPMPEESFLRGHVELLFRGIESRPGGGS